MGRQNRRDGEALVDVHVDSWKATRDVDQVTPCSMSISMSSQGCPVRVNDLRVRRTRILDRPRIKLISIKLPFFAAQHDFASYSSSGLNRDLASNDSPWIE